MNGTTAANPALATSATPAAISKNQISIGKKAHGSPALSAVECAIRGECELIGLPPARNLQFFY
jgi:hypothetical protein